MWLNWIGRLLNPKADLSRLPKQPGDGSPAMVRQGRLRLHHVLLNGPLLLGSTIVLGLFLIVLFGPVIAPENPYLTGQRSLTYEAGEITAPPFPPSTTFPLGTDQWGRDILSLLLYGARNTLVAGVFIAMARLILGVGLGAVAGWYEGKLFDRFIMGVVSLTTALPILISGMILIYAFDIRRGLPTFIAALVSHSSSTAALSCRVAGEPSSARPRVRSGWSRAKRLAAKPPLEPPTSTAAPIPTASRNASMSAAKSLVV
jgi:ABC-type dipeptide/oligopeptide/nickel transport system permease subunit